MCSVGNSIHLSSSASLCPHGRRLKGRDESTERRNWLVIKTWGKPVHLDVKTPFTLFYKKKKTDRISWSERKWIELVFIALRFLTWRCQRLLMMIMLVVPYFIMQWLTDSAPYRLAVSNKEGKGKTSRFAVFLSDLSVILNFLFPTTCDRIGVVSTIMVGMCEPVTVAVHLATLPPAFPWPSSEWRRNLPILSVTESAPFWSIHSNNGRLVCHMNIPTSASAHLGNVRRRIGVSTYGTHSILYHKSLVSASI